MGAWWEMILKQSKDKLHSILCSIGSQWREWSIGVTGFHNPPNSVMDYRTFNLAAYVIFQFASVSARETSIYSQASWPMTLQSLELWVERIFSFQLQYHLWKQSSEKAWDNSTPLKPVNQEQTWQRLCTETLHVKNREISGRAKA